MDSEEILNIERNLVRMLLSFGDKAKSIPINFNVFRGQHRRRIAELACRGYDFVSILPELDDFEKNEFYEIHMIDDAPYFNEETIKHYESSLAELRLKDLPKEILEEGIGFDSFQSELEKRSRTLSGYRGLSFSESVNSTMEEIEHGSVDKIKVGLESVDNMVGGFLRGMACVVAGRPSMGKSAFSTFTAYNAAVSGRRVYIQALEETCHSIICRILSRLSGVENRKIQTGNLTPSEKARIRPLRSKVASLNIVIEDRAFYSAESICGNIRKAHNEKKIDVVVIDHIQEIRGKGFNRHDIIGNAANLFKMLAKELNCVVFIVSQLSRGAEQREDHRPRISDLKESGDIEQVADYILLLYRPGYYDRAIPKSETHVLCPKVRNGSTGSCVIDFDMEHINFKEAY